MLVSIETKQELGLGETATSSIEWAKKDGRVLVRGYVRV